MKSAGTKAQKQKIAGKKAASHALKKSGVRVRSLDNIYLRTLLKPEQYRNVRYPDSYGAHTAMTPAIMNEDLYYFPADSTGTPSAEAAGKYLAIWSPTMLNPVLQYVMDNVAAVEYLTMGFVQQGDEEGFFPLQEDAPFPATSADQPLLVCDGTYQNVRGVFAWSDQDFALPCMRGLLPDESVIYGVPFSDVLNAGTLTVSFNLNSAQAFPVNSVISVMALNGKGQTVTASTTLAAPATAINLSLTINTLMQTLANGQVAAALPGIAFRVSATWGAAGGFTPVLPINGVYIQMKTGAARPGSFWTNRFSPLAYPSEKIYCETVDKYRVVSGSCWLAYQGSGLQDGGQHGALYYPGGQSPFAIGLYDYGKVTTTPGGYQGPVKFGSYTYWIPGDPRDMLYRRLSPVDRWSLPFIVLTGYMATPSQVESIRLRAVANIEIISSEQIYSYDMGPNDPEMIREALLAIGKFPTSMENPEHLKMIGEVLERAANGVADTVRKGASWIWDNKETLVPLALAAAGSL